MAFSKKGKEEAAKAALSPAPEALSELEASQLFTEDPLEALLDEQSDEDFGDLELKERSGKPVKLAEWSAQDFSSIYLRFRPHLERHARRFLRNPSQVDEVVQDAFLYLMVSLPELDSEIGVLRFLKWKTRLLALDVIRASGRAYINSIDDVQEPESNDPEVSSNLEQQDDAAVVRLALSKLNPRHREVLIASMYEEKSTEEIASQVGLSENATRQLIFRARAAFKKALIGDIDTTGMSAAAILSVAARKAASEGKKVGAAALTLIALVVMSVTVFPGLNRATTDQMAEAPVNPGSSDSSNQAAGEVAPSPDSEAVDDSAANTEAAVNAQGSASTAPVKAQGSASTAPVKAKKSPIESALSAPALGGIINADSRSFVFVLDQTYTAVGENGLIVSFTFNPTSQPVFSSVEGQVQIENLRFTFKPVNPALISGKNGQDEQVFIFVGDIGELVDQSGKNWPSTDLGKSKVKIEVLMESNGVTVKSINLLIFKN
jgi:RNA polymerase sigma factor (sigma-70 family)